MLPVPKKQVVDIRALGVTEAVLVREAAVREKNSRCKESSRFG